MVITDITVTKRGRYSLFVDGDFLFSVDGQTVLEYGLKKGLEVDCGFLDELQSACLEKKARDKAMDLLSRRPYGERELIDRLAKDFPRPLCAALCATLRDAGLIDDRAFAGQLCEEYGQLRGFSARRIKQELYKRGFDRELIEELCAPDEEEEVARARRLIEKSYLRKLGMEGGPDKVRAALSRQGFSYGTIREAMREYITEED